jgi:hypothetical protein
MAISPSNTHAVAAIRKRLAEVSGELIVVERRWRSLREAHHALSQTLRMFDPEAASHQVKPKRPYRRVLPKGGGKLSRLVLDVLRASQQPMTTPEIVSAVVAALGYGDEATQAIADRVPTTLSYMARTRGSVVREGEGRATEWALLLTNC